MTIDRSRRALLRRLGGREESFDWTDAGVEAG